MLRIRANGIFLNLPEDIQFNYVVDNAFMLVNRIPSPIGLSFDIGLTAPNLKAFNYPNRTTIKQTLGEVPGEISFDNIVFSNGYFKVESCKTTINISYRGSSFDDNFTKQLNNVEMQRYDFGTGNAYENSPVPGPRFGQFAANFFTLMDSVNADANAKFVVAPVKTTSPTSFKSQFIQDNTYINAYDAHNKRWYKHGSSGGNSKMFPMPYLHYVIDTIFGGFLTENPFKVGDLKKLVLVTTHHPNADLSAGTYILDSKFPFIPPKKDANGVVIRDGQTLPIPPQYFVDTFLKLNSFCSNIKVNELLKDLLKIICASLYPDKDRWKIVTNKSILESTVVENWNDKLIEELGNNLLESKKYQFSYTNAETKEEFPDDRIEVDTIAQMRNQDVSNFEDGAHIYVKTTKQLYLKETADGKNTYELVDDGLSTAKDDEDTGDVFEMSTKVQPLPMTIAQYFYRVGARDEFFLDWFVPLYEGNVLEKSDNAYIMFYHGTKASFVAADTYPYLTPYNYDHFGEKIGDVSLAYDGAEGVGNLYHKEFKAWVEKKKLKAAGAFSLSAVDLKMLDLTLKKNIRGRNFFVEKLQVTITLNSIKPALIDFIEA